MSYVTSQVLRLIEIEYYRAAKKFAKFNSAHEGYAVILEELDELWEEIKSKKYQDARDTAMMSEAVQVAAMALRLVVDVIPHDMVVAKLAEDISTATEPDPCVTSGSR